ncbi:class I SAM-dependent methyltransferase [Deinococcus sp. MIMF12]|uniref:Class I SAM-dependent methyltransferase n=1 Tax=Deinococcus rhizophilus TaxID=3049544 RepID=A0ABT7JEK6_9DEIO|nr:class I SAM-dependent methyltransferase [Deinococcus rhizophilus]MDL2343376.1 class I SAM-dependent methyltransferase [Deinococcus rhizophilus]
MTDSPEYNDPRLVPLYDLQNRWGADDDFFLALANGQPGRRILDLGCGTGRLTTALARAGHRVTGVDPARASLDVAQSKPGAEAVNWIHGTAKAAPGEAFDLALMTSHVAQIFEEDAAWAEVLGHLHRALVPGGRLAFDSRDPAARGWEVWDSGDERERVTLPDGQELEAWMTVDGVTDGRVTFTGHMQFLASGERITDRSTLRFRTEAELRQSLMAAGFAVETIYGGWHGERVGEERGELVVVARKPE